VVGSLDLTDPSTTLLEVIKKVGLVFQTPESQFFEVFVGDEIAYGPKQLKMADIKERVHRAMAMVGLDFDIYKDRRLQTLSGGEKRKVAIASTLVLDQEILLFDEPIAGMDPQARDKLLSLINKLHENGKTIIITSHRLEELARMTKTVSLIVQGLVSISGTTPSVLGDAEKIQKAKLKPPVITQVAHELIRKGWPIDREDTTTAKNLIAALKKVMS
jgi:energy-coupling factor transport system ATP-binding protein